ncbi:MAG: 23S rRNA pseudouridine synthase [Chloroflexi bacterium]|nr:MAG: 23S rRNA pseudouridine synthase [Chloroflexota bacterium]
MTAKTLTFQVISGESDRVDKFLALHLPDYSRSRFQNLIREAAVKVNNEVVNKTGCIVVEGDLVEILLPEAVASELLPEDIALDVVFENGDLAIINKRAGMVVHPAAGHDTGTLVHAALARFKDLKGIGGELRPGVVHRLDKDTSGLIIIAKNEQAHRWLQDQFRLRNVEKIYLALVDGKPPTPTGRVEAAIARDPSHRKKMAIVSDAKGRASVTEYRTVEVFSNHTLIEAHPVTGRTHQIRLHMAFLKCPIVGDTVYGRSHPSIELNRHFLHAAKLKILFPGETNLRTFEAPLPNELVDVINSIR